MVRFISLFRFRQRISRARGQKGATAVEMALIAPVFFLFLIGTVEMCLIEAGQQLLENATYNTSRLASTGYTANGQNQQQTVNQTFINELQAFGGFIDTTQITMTATAYNSFSSAGSGNG